VTDSLERLVAVRVAVRDLTDEFRAALLSAFGRDGWDRARLHAVVSTFYGFLGPFAVAHIEPSPDPQIPESHTLVIEFRPPADRDLSQAENAHDSASHLANVGQLREAARVFEGLTHEFPEIAKYHASLGQARFQIQDLEGAEDALLHALRLDARDHRALLMLGNLYMKKRDHGQAARLYRAAVAVEAEPFGLTNLGAALAEAGDVEGAIELFRRALDLEPDHQQAILGLTMAERRLEGGK
jgi:tetratricopeptide (TPR) repeat protein